MRDFIGLLLLFALVSLGLYYEHKAKKRKEYDEWIYCRRKNLQSIALHFRNDCQSLAQEVFTQYTANLLWKSYLHMPDYITYSFLSNYKEAIIKLKAEYIANPETESLPNYLIEEYEKNISDIASTFLELADLMRNQIEEAKERNNERS